MESDKRSGQDAVAGLGPKGPGPRGGKGSVMTTRITGEMRLALEAEAARSGRSIGQVAELWMERERARAHLGPTGASVDAAAWAMIQFAEVVTEQIGDPASSEAARDAMRAGWSRIVQRSLPFAVDKTEAGKMVRQARRAVSDAVVTAKLGIADGELQLKHRALFLSLTALARGIVTRAEMPELLEHLKDEAKTSQPLAMALKPLIIALPRYVRAAEEFEAQRDAAIDLALDLLDGVVLDLPHDISLDLNVGDRGDPGS